MAYQKQTWKCGDTISADKLNHMEEGIANSGGMLVVNIDHTETEVVDGVTYTLYVYDKTFKEVYDAIHNGIPCFIHLINDHIRPIVSASVANERPRVRIPTYTSDPILDELVTLDGTINGAIIFEVEGQPK